MNASFFNRIVAVYGIGADTFLDLFESQGHACAICRHPLVLFSTMPEEQPQMDHCHSSGKVRGILCRTCNVAVGFLEKNPVRTAKAANYIQQEGFIKQSSEPRGRYETPPESETADWKSKDWREWRLRVKPPSIERRKRHHVALDVKKMLDSTKKTEEG